MAYQPWYYYYKILLQIIRSSPINYFLHFSCGFRGKQGRRFLSLAIFFPAGM
jgi:hypothetical protein